jgi:hypothetical protein
MAHRIDRYPARMTNADKADTYELTGGLPAGLVPDTILYVLGTGGPDGPDGIGDLSSFVWRFHTIVRESEPRRNALAFTSMPQLMGFTRAVNGRAPFTVPTQALRISPAAIETASGWALVVDPTLRQYDALMHSSTAEDLPCPELESAVA